jgi:hypothetical protein
MKTTALVGSPSTLNAGLPLPRAAEGEHGFGEDQATARQPRSPAGGEHLRVGASKVKRRLFYEQGDVNF